MDFVILEVDGSLANPVPAGAVAVWTVLLSGIAGVLGRRLARTWSYWPAGTLLFVVAVLATKPAQLLIGNVLYWIVDQRITSVGFWGGPPVWIAPVVSCCVGPLTWAAARRARLRLQDS